MPRSSKQDQSATSTGTASTDVLKPARRSVAAEDRFDVDSWEPSLLARMRKAMGGKACTQD